MKVLTVEKREKYLLLGVIMGTLVAQRLLS